jgi:hypothetical protein
MELASLVRIRDTHVDKFIISESPERNEEYIGAR